MTTSNERMAKMFNEAMAQRDLGAHDAAIDILNRIVSENEPAVDLRIYVHSLNQIAFMRFEAGDYVASERASLDAVRLAPRFERASVRLFHSLAEQNRWHDAVAEAARFTSLKDSKAYRELFLDQGFIEGLDRSIHEDARRVRDQLARWC